jgi:hypothetical protein
MENEIITGFVEVGKSRSTCSLLDDYQGKSFRKTTKKGAHTWEHVARQFAAFREAYLLEMEKDEKDDDNQVVWVERIGDSVMNRFQRTIQRQVKKFNILCH